MDSNGRRASSSWGTVLVLLIVPPFALIALGVVALAALASVVALAGAVLATPYLLAHLLRRHLAERLRSTEASGPVARVIAEAGMATQQSGVAALANRPRQADHGDDHCNRHPHSSAGAPGRARPRYDRGDSP